MEVNQQSVCQPRREYNISCSPETSLNGSLLPKEVDTGVAVSIISENMKNRLLPTLQLRESSMLLRTLYLHRGTHQSSRRDYTFSVQYGTRTKSLELIVAPGD